MTAPPSQAGSVKSSAPARFFNAGAARMRYLLLYIHTDHFRIRESPADGLKKPVYRRFLPCLREFVDLHHTVSPAGC
jgi:hypothetical protein